MHRLHFNFNSLGLVAATVLLVIGGVLLWGHSRATGETITVCVKKTGLVYVIGEGFKRTDCKPGDTLLSWNTEGPTGPQGPQGLQGPAGAAGMNVHLLDGNGQDLGLLLDADPYGPAFRCFGFTGSVCTSFTPNAKTYRTFIPSANAVIPIRGDGKTQTAVIDPVANRTVFFGGTNCTGTAFVTASDGGIDISTNMLLRATGPRYFAYIGGPSVASPAAQSVIPVPFGQVCLNTSTTTPTALPVQEVTLSFTEPINWPLKIQSQ